MNTVNTDVSKGKSILTILLSYGEMVSSPHEIRHTSEKIDSFIKKIKAFNRKSKRCHGIHRQISQMDGSLAVRNRAINV